MLLSSLFSLGLLLSHHLGLDTAAYAEEILGRIEFDKLLLDWVLCCLRPGLGIRHPARCRRGSIGLRQGVWAGC